MGLTVYWTQLTQDKLEDIFEYYKFKAGIKVAQTLVNGIIDSSLSLEINAYSGQKEVLLSTRAEDFRYLVFKNYKIIYWIDEARQLVYVSNIFDTRQNPQKLALGK
ncbi:type II toxin-antitoxin system RelE/ParE family toxin [Flavobacterium pectinovorum]|uniref:Type II toxin-antitoxin system RelE/ParE family toxin n=1 Tax=Flavobacterium pectinovorum TaxID=29533 RepID=A0A502F0Z9_9FLAO|nr:type II toxin-antitoxin system RelE/ParE family toxin [Flavobacterium pectinovorum]TPG42111.1 type II toxin-antitoxin system RelE/ParE family toxin [Flavobacterium pectinovorum]